MPLYRAFLRTLGSVALLALSLACGGKSKATSSPAVTTATISGTVTYKRVPLIKDTNGVPGGLADASVAANLQSLPARGTVVRIYQQREQTLPDGSKTLVWTIAGSVITNSSGLYSITVAKDRLTMVEVLSSFSSGNGFIHLIADPAGINSSALAANRLRYALRKATDGSAPANNNAPSSMLTVNAVVDFTVDLNDAWWLVDPAYNFSTNEAPLVTSARLETGEAGRTAGFGTGSRVLGIGDTIASFVAVYGSATPGAPLDLHYWPGLSETRGSYIDYGPYGPGHFPSAYDSSIGGYLFFGSLRGGPTNDDAWDEGIILPLLARNLLFASNRGRTYSVPSNPVFSVAAALTDLSPDLARIEGLAEAMAANLLKSPYLADTQGTALATPVLDIRDIGALGSAQLTPYSAPALRALAWEIILKANSLASPGNASTWATINPLATVRFFFAPSPTKDATRDLEPLNIYSQLARLKEIKSAAEPADLAAIFPDSVLIPLTGPYGLLWPRPTTGAYAAFVADWGTDPNALTTPLAPFTLSMAKAVPVQGSYPNASQDEVLYSGFSLNADKRYIISMSISPALDAGNQIDLDLPQLNRTFSFSGPGGSSPAVTIPVGGTAPFYHPARVRLKSPGAVQPDVAVTLSFTPSP